MIARSALLTVIAAGLSFGAEAFVGTWKPNPDKWKDSPGAPENRKSNLFKLEAITNGHYRQTQFSPDGKRAGPTVDLFLDGKEHPVGDGDMATVRRVSDMHISISVKGPKGVTTMEYMVSADGRALTVTRGGVGTKSGRPIDEVHEYTKE
jgi:hypothetical protein